VRHVLLILLVGCEPFSSPAATTPPPVVVTPPPVIENHVTFVTVLPPPAEDMPPAPPAPAPPEPPPAATPPPAAAPPPAEPPPIEPAVRRPRPPYCTCMETAVLPVHPTTTVPACDHYLARTEASLRCSTDDPGAIKRVMMSLDLSWRQWRDVAGGQGRKYLLDSCDVVDKEMDLSLADACR
jgi:hypothetical protein